ncbi:MAG: nucleotide exchange factor GrpE [Ginsengibacter sp.]
MDNSKKDLYETNDSDPIEAEDFSVNENDEHKNLQEEVFEASLSNEENTKLSAELEEQKDKYVRLFAEFDNFKRRSAKERIELIQTAGKEVIASLLQVLDDTDRAEKQMQETNDPEPIKEGVQLVFNKLRKTLKSKGLEPMESMGTEFDVEKHEAITEIPVEDKKQKGKVVDEIEKGYYLNNKLIRFAKVVLGK